jgi:hypothetical protein
MRSLPYFAGKTHAKQALNDFLAQVLPRCMASMQGANAI